MEYCERNIKKHCNNDNDGVVLDKLLHSTSQCSSYKVIEF